MANGGLQICPHTCGCDTSDNAVYMMARNPMWLGRCPIYETTGTGMKHHLIGGMHRQCKHPCLMYTSVREHGRELTQQEFETWTPYIGHLPQFRPHIPTQYQHFIAVAPREPSSLTKHPLPSPPAKPPHEPGRYYRFSASSKPSSAPERGGTRISLGARPQETSTSQNPPYGDFFKSYLGPHASAAQSSVVTEKLPPAASILPVTPSSTTDILQSNGSYHVLKNMFPQSASTPHQSDASQSNANYNVLKFRASLPKNSEALISPSAPPQHRSSPHPLPTRDLATFERILGDTHPEAVAAAVLAAYAAVPAVQKVLWEHLSNTARAPDGSVCLVARHQVCRHCAEEFDTAEAGELCTWHYGSALLDPAQWVFPPPMLPGGGPDAGMYFWDCCGARLSSRAPGCITTAHAPIIPPDSLALSMTTSETSRPGVKRKRAEGPTLHCGHCAGTYRLDDGAGVGGMMVCWWGIRIS
ncbi:hypothetical protein B0H16DRAFT_1535869 [Mycena metata]|uniref:Uncharacterized protein n=1 Tax=Mycena metata TaxID=1033252 RepID=A0AAD7J6R3_9AGAR|nr:hypothetical protein B0H16DRAFT_1535869 [Mycena metata]